MKKKDKKCLTVEFGDYSIQRTDPLNWKIVKSGTTESGKPTFKTLGYYPQLDMAAFRLLDIISGKEPVDDVEELIDNIISAKTKIVEAIGKIQHKMAKE